MRAPSFWWRERPGFAALLLAPAGALYAFATRRRMAREGARCGVPVICVGNPTAGGAGKRPLALEIARLLIEAGEKPAFVSRGHGGAIRGKPLRVDPARHDAALAGDEPLLLARVAPVFVCADRAAAARMAAGEGATVVVMDDGMQNPALRKDLTFAVVDGGAGLGNGLCVPAGPLRAAFADQLGWFDALVVSGEGPPGERAVAEAPGKPVFHARLVPDSAASARLGGARVVAFAGIGRPEKFFATLRDMGAGIEAERPFPDHHRFTPAELGALSGEARAREAILVTTEKDAARLPPNFGAVAVPVRMDIADVKGLRKLILDALARARRRSVA